MTKFFTALLIIGLGFGVAIFWIKNKTPQIPLVVPEKTWTVQVMPAQLQALAPQVRLYARIESPHTAQLTASVNADVADVLVREGDQVDAGAVLARLDPHELKLALQQRIADVAEIEAAINSEKNRHANDLSSLPREQTLLKLTRNAAERAQSLKQQRAASESSVEETLQAVERQALTLSARQLQITNHAASIAQLQARLKRAQAQRDLAQLDLDRSVIKAPFRGIVAQVQIAPGERARVATPLFSLYDTQQLEARAQIPERYLSLVYAALQQRTRLAAHADSKGQVIRLEADRLAGQVQPNSGGTDALFRVLEGAEALRLGLFLELHLQLPPEEQVIAVPYEAIYGNDRLYILADGRMRNVQVERLGEYQNAAGERLSLVRSAQISAAMPIIVTHLPNAMEGLKVRVSEGTAQKLP